MAAGYPAHLRAARNRRALQRIARAAERAGLDARIPRGQHTLRLSSYSGVAVDLYFGTSHASNGESFSWPVWVVELADYPDAGRRWQRFDAPPWIDGGRAELGRMVWQRGGPNPQDLHRALAELVADARARAAAMPDPDTPTQG